MKTLILFLFISISSIAQSNAQIVALKKGFEFENILKSEVIMISNSIDFRSSINSIQRFESVSSEEKIIIKSRYDWLNKNISTGKLIKDKISIDARTLVKLLLRNNQNIDFLMDEFGHVLYEGNVYEGSIDLLMFFRKGIDEWGNISNVSVSSKNN